MKIYTLKSAARRGSMLVAAFVVAGASLLPFASASADALNPLTDRSLTLSSSSPGWDYKDGSGNSTYAPPNSGANGRQTGNTFVFKVSTDSTDTGTDKPIMAMTFQYCTTSAGKCAGPGNNDDHTLTNDAVLAAGHQTSDLDIVTASPSAISSGEFTTYVDATTGAVKEIPAANSTGKNFVVYYQSAGVNTPANTTDDVWTYSPDWEMTTANVQATDATDPATNKQNFITLANTGDGAALKAGTPVKVVFFATNTNYITNPGSSWFFVKINTYSDVDLTDAEAPEVDAADLIDGGVTVANVMNRSIQITTKVLETMEFSVGTVDPNTLDETQLLASDLQTDTHSICQRILTRMVKDDDKNTNLLRMGNQTGEFSLETGHTYSTHSYWRLSSNSSAGATVYYSGNTLSNTVDDKIDPIGPVMKSPAPGSEQFGLALANGDGTDVTTDGNGVTTGYKVNYATETFPGKVFEYGADDAAAGLAAFNIPEGIEEEDPDPIGTGVHQSYLDDASSNLSYHYPQLYPLIPTANYGSGAGPVNTEYGSTANTKFAFDETSQQIPIAIATEDAEVVDCVTGKMRYIANIAATTPAGIYTTKVNYIAAPQY